MSHCASFRWTANAAWMITSPHCSDSLMTLKCGGRVPTGLEAITVHESIQSPAHFRQSDTPPSSCPSAGRFTSRAYWCPALTDAGPVDRQTHLGKPSFFAAMQCCSTRARSIMSRWRNYPGFPIVQYFTIIQRLLGTTALCRLDEAKPRDAGDPNDFTSRCSAEQPACHS